jgi:hypothetical protein
LRRVATLSRAVASDLDLAGARGTVAAALERMVPSTGKDDGGEERRRQGANAEGGDDDAAEVATVVERGTLDEEDWVARRLSRWAGGGRRQMQHEVGALGGVSRGWRGTCGGFAGRRR